MSSFILFEWVCRASLHGAAGILVVWALRPVFRRWFGARATHLLWLLVPVILLVPNLPGASFAMWKPQIGSLGIEKKDALRVTVSVKEAQGLSPAASRESASRGVTVCVLIWLGGTTLFAAVALLQSGRAARLARRAPLIGKEDPVWRALAQLPGAPAQVRIRETNELRTPALCGIFRPAVLLPKGWTDELTAEELRCVLLHEIGHLQRGDLIWRWLFLIARAVHWFNPLVWMAERSARLDQELACDEWVLAQESPPTAELYGEVLLKASQLLAHRAFGSPVHATMAESKSGLHHRICHLNEIHTHGWRAMGAALVTSAGLVVLVAPSNGQIRIAKTPAIKEPTGETVPAASGPIIEVQVRFVEVTAGPIEAVLRQITGFRGTGNGSIPQIGPLFSQTEFGGVLEKLKAEKIDFLANSSLKASQGQKATISTGSEFRYATKQTPHDAPESAKAAEFDSRNTGVTLEVQPIKVAGGRIELELTPQVVEFVGYLEEGAEKKLKASLKDEALPSGTTRETVATGVGQPVFETRRASTRIKVTPGQTALIAGLSSTAPKARHELWMFVSARIMDEPAKIEPAPQAPVEKPAADSAKANKKLTAVAVIGMPGFVISPYAPLSGMIDVRGFPPGTEVLCPYTKAIFVVP